MKALLAKRSKRRSIGLLVGEREIATCVMAATPLGRVELARTCEARGSEPLDDQLERMLGPWLKGRPRPKVALGVPEVRVFHASRTLNASVRKDPEIWLQEALQSAGTRIEDMVIELAEALVGKQPVGSLVACRKKVLAGPLEALSRRSARLVLAEPTPCALLRAAASQLKVPRKSKLSARFILGDRQAIGMLVAGILPLQWRVFDLPTGAEPNAIHSALVSLRMQARHWKLETEIDAVLIQGRPDLAERLDPLELGAQMGVKVARADGPSFDSGSIAMGLAMGGLIEENHFDLARTFKQPEMIGEIFPYGDLVMQAAMLAGILLLVSEKARSLDTALTSTQASLKKFRWLGDRQESDLDAEKKVLQLKDKTAEGFLSSRVLWSGHVRDIASHLPSNSKLTSLTGAGELDDLGGKGTGRQLKKTMVMRLESPIPPTGETPRELDDLLESLRDRSRVRRDFPVIEIKDIKTSRGTGKGAGLVASYSIVCLPKAPKPAAPKPSAKSEK
jgi:hypothetical protein